MKFRANWTELDANNQYLWILKLSKALDLSGAKITPLTTLGTTLTYSTSCMPIKVQKLFFVLSSEVKT